MGGIFLQILGLILAGFAAGCVTGLFGGGGGMVLVPLLSLTALGEDSVFPSSIAVILPGGLPGTTNLAASNTVNAALEYAARHPDILIAAICAAPSVLGELGLLQGLKATCYPGYEQALAGAKATGNAVERDGRVITGKGAGVTVDFALTIVSALCSDEKAKSLKEAMQCR